MYELSNIFEELSLFENHGRGFFEGDGESKADFELFSAKITPQIMMVFFQRNEFTNKNVGRENNFCALNLTSDSNFWYNLTNYLVTN